ncbi:MAG TPA: TIGR03790 family protein, partial [Oceanipulchritudo sp.]|nr:TIGR03790 family protein [Oceanipulchritudo sp.]
MPSENRWSGHVTGVLILFLAMGTGLWGQAPGPGPESVVVVANSAFEGSLKVARAYMQRRDIPEENLILLETTSEGRISREAFAESIYNPILEALRERKLIDAFEGNLDAYGRESVTLFSSKVRYMVLCYGVPFQVGQMEVLEKDDLPYRQRHFKGSLASFAQSFAQGNMSRNDASVDGELALILRREAPLKGFYPNPLHKNRLPDTVRDVLRVTRLDGPSAEAVIRMLDNSLIGEREGLKGQAYVDEDGRSGTYQTGNTWMAGAAQVFEALGYGLIHNTAGPVFRADERFDAPVLYAGWYAANITGPFTLPGFRFPPGAVAAHLHSFSATNMRDAKKGWVGPFVDRGVSATFGNVAEPYLTLTHHFDLFFSALANGWNFADAAYYALPGL